MKNIDQLGLKGKDWEINWTGKSYLYTFLVVAFWILTSNASFAEQVSINATVDKNTVALNDVVQYTITVSGEGINNLSPSTPNFLNLRVISRSQSSNISIINGRVSTAYSHIYILQPEKEGVANIGISTITVGRNTYQTEPISITVTKPTSESKQQRQSGSSGNLNSFWDEIDDLFSELRDRPYWRTPVPSSQVDPVLAKTSLSCSTCYVNQMVILTFTFYRRVNLMENPTYSPPSTTGFWSIELPSKKDGRYEILNGIRYLAQDLKTALFPTQAGELTIPPATISVKIDPFSAPITITTKPLKLKVLPLPEHGKDKNLIPAVGRWSMSTMVDKSVVQRGKPFTLWVKITGNGNINTIPEPLLKIESNLKKLGVHTKENINKGFDSVVGSKTFEYILMPIKEGTCLLCPVKFLYFDPYARKYIEQVSNPFKIKILPSNIPLHEEIEKETKLPERAIIKIDKKIIIKTFLVIFIIIILGIVIFLTSWAIKKYRKYLHSDPVKNRRRIAMKKARNSFKRAKELLKKDSLKESVANVYEAVIDYLGDKYNFASTGITREQIKDLLAQQGIPLNVRQTIDKFILECDLIRWTPAELDKEKVNEIIKTGEEIIKNCKK